MHRIYIPLLYALLIPLLHAAPSASTARPASAARPAGAARPVPGSRPEPPPRRVPGMPPPRPVDTKPVRVNGNLVVARTPDGRPVPIVQPGVVVNVPGAGYGGLHNPGSFAHLAVCPSCRRLADKETLQHLNAWLVGEQGRRLNAQLNRMYPPPPPHHKKPKPKKRR